MTKPAPISTSNLAPGDFVNEVTAHPTALVYLLCNIGDGDAQVILLPRYGTPLKRQVVVIHVGVTDKVPALLAALEADGILEPQQDSDDSIALVVATHPHQDHIGGLPDFLRRYGNRVAEYWDPRLLPLYPRVSPDHD